MSQSTPVIFAMGNPLLDMQVTNGEAVLKKYDLKADDAILAEEKHASMYASCQFLSSYKTV
jgi:adenosine kinase